MIKTDLCPNISDALPLDRIFGTPSAKVLDFLILNHDFDYSESDISRLAEVPSRTLQRVIPCLLSEQLVKRTRKSGKAFMYKADFESKRTQALQQYVKTTIEENLRTPELFGQKPKIEKENETLSGM